MADEFDPERARTKRPLPLWVKDFVHDVQDLEADEVGAYLLILMAMWGRKSCDFPEDMRKLARVCRAGQTVFKRRIWPAIRGFFRVENGTLISDKLRQNAGFVESHVSKQSNRRSSNKSDKPLKYNKADETTEKPRKNRGDNRGTHLPTTYKNTSYSIARDEDNLSVFGERKQPDLDSAFERFWVAYPHRGGAVPHGQHGRALGVFRAKVADGADPQSLVDKATEFRKSRQAVDGFAPDAVRWLGEDHWKNDFERSDKAPPDPVSQADLDALQRKNLQWTAERMRRSGASWIIGSVIVSDHQIERMRQMGIGLDKIEGQDT